MVEYAYRAARINGKKVKGKKEVQSEVDLKEALESEGLYLISYEDAVVKVIRPFKPKLLAEFCRELGMMLGSGISLVRALNVMIQRDIGEKEKDSYSRLHMDIQRGSMLSEAMENQNGVYPDFLISMVKSSEISGAMEQTLIRMADHFEKSNKLKQKVRSAMTYPIILAIVTITAVVAIFKFILPKFFSMFQDMGTDLPALTQFMVNMMAFFQAHGIIILMVVVIFILTIIVLSRLEKVREIIDQLKLKLPVFGKLNKIIYTARFARTLSSCYSSGVSMINSIKSARDTIGNKFVESQFDDLMNDIRNGDALSVAVDKIEGFDKKLVANIKIGEETGRLDVVLESTANNFDYESEVALDKMTTIIEPVMIVIMASIIGVIAISVLLPLPAMYNSVGQLGGM